MQSIKRWLFYLKLAWLDLFRLRTSVVLHVVIVTGICLPILILLGLKRGHIAELRHDLVTSPTGRQIIVAVGGRGEMITPDNISRLESELGPVDVIIPDSERVADLSQVGDTTTVVKGVTLRSTRPGDPVLAVQHADVLAASEPAVVLYESVAGELGVSVGDAIELTVTRRAGTARETASTSLTVKAVVPSESDDKVAYVNIAIIDAMERYIRGGRVEEFGWPPMRGSVRDRYAEYLLFCELSGNLTVDDIDAFKGRGLIVEEVVDEDLRLLYGLLKPETLDKLVLYRVFTEQSRIDPAARLVMSPPDVAAISAADDVAIPWNVPRRLPLAGRDCLLVGFSLPRRTWLKTYMVDPSHTCSYQYEQIPVIFPYHREPINATSDSGQLQQPGGDESTDGESVDNAKGPGDLQNDNLELKFDQAKSVLLSAVPVTSINPGESRTTGSELAVVPVQLLAHLDAYETGRADFDAATRQFIPVPLPPTYTQVRIYANTIDDVLPVISKLEEKHYAYRAQNSRIKEIQGQDRQLEDLVFIVGAGVFLFGVFTVFSVLLEATERKRGTIGILRVMGVSRPGIFMIVFVRAIAVGLLAGLLTWGLGLGITATLNWEPDESSPGWLQTHDPEVTAILNTDDVLLILTGSTICCLVGSVFPAWRASQRDPFDAILEGRFR